ncbi:uroporphyrinogen-III C-methyltransferase [Rhodocytophaga aerolata]|uniref:uroporphyrinogen-III C-methyltransferase n=1 Tax=Rhodocytophaga aerolata TaxID=455078 RepID=A0ABT8RAP0_9BACT|nr:uroporphyrinogen-III C-methyltransferase [Rhodocytophaga aerolata]MDO1448313.1 uroporphyrinogen-III C-methyltransferase [Rhodocytophaga aerolata]
MKNNIKPKVTLVGAGPGDADLITLKGIKALQKADIVLYDALVNKELLEYIPVDTPAIFVGKRFENHSYTQEQINQLIVDSALTYGHVVRLKGGDSFVFGRGHEEIMYARAHNIETSVIPGISSSIAVPELQQIPLTSRGISESFWVLTGTTKKGEVSADIELAAQSNATAIILMGVHQLRQICALYQKYNKGQQAVAVIQNGSLPDEKIALGTIDTIVDVALDQAVGSPAIIVIGDVVKEHPEYLLEISKQHFKDLIQNR